MPLKITRRKRPHWTLEGAIYFVTFTLREGKFTEEEQGIIFDHIFEGNERFYDIFNFVVMPNHVHLLFTLNEKYTLSDVMKGMKGVSSRKINIHRNASGTNWIDESYDRIVRNKKELRNVLRYIERNPFKAGLVKDGDPPYRFYFIDEDWLTKT